MRRRGSVPIGLAIVVLVTVLSTKGEAKPPPPPSSLPIPVSFPFRIDQPSQDSQILYPQELNTNVVLDNASGIKVGADFSQCTGTPELVLLDCTDASCTVYGIAATVDLVPNPADGWQISAGDINETGTISKGHYLVWSPHNDVCPSLTATGSAVGHVVP